MSVLSGGAPSRAVRVGSLLRDHDAGVPARRPSPGGRLRRLGVDPAASEGPCDHGVRVPHLARAELVAAPHRCRNLRDDAKYAASALLVLAESPWTVDGLGDVRYVAARPEPDLVAEDPTAARPPGADGAFGDDAALLAAPVVHRGLLDHERRLPELDLERGVVEVARRPALQPRRQPLVEAAVDPDEVPARSERQPVQVYRRHR